MTHIRRLISQFAAGTVTQPEGGWQKLFFDLMAEGEEADRVFCALMPVQKPSYSPFQVVGGSAA